MKVLLTGASGQLGKELLHAKPGGIDLYAYDSKSLDITNIERLESTFAQINPDVVINAAAYTTVDKAETEQDLAHAVNAVAPGNIARICGEFNSRLIHISTDFVFSGNSPLPYLPEDQTDPVNFYGKSKLDGELAVKEQLNEGALIFRTAWLYSVYGHNFVRTMLRLMQEKEKLEVVYDQIGTPTWARGLSKIIWKAVIKNPKVSGIFHSTDAGVASWYDFAVAIQEEAIALGILKKRISIIPVRTYDYPVRAIRPANSLLDCSKTWNELTETPANWHVSLKAMLESNLSR